jgi:ribosomal protein S18
VEELESTNTRLRETEHTLNCTKTVLQRAATEREEQRHLVEKHVETELKLAQQAKKLLATRLVHIEKQYQVQRHLAEKLGNIRHKVSTNNCSREQRHLVEKFGNIRQKVSTNNCRIEQRHLAEKLGDIRHKVSTNNCRKEQRHLAEKLGNIRHKVSTNNCRKEQRHLAEKLGNIRHKVSTKN